MTRRIRGFALPLACLAALTGCGSDDFENKPRPPVTLQISGVITEEGVTVSPAQFGAGPVVLTISNQDSKSHTVTLAGTQVKETVGPINPQDTAALQKTLPPGRYEVRAGSEGAVRRGEELDPAVLEIGRQREDSSDRVLLP